MVTGMPAQVKDRLMMRHRELIEHVAASYVELAQQYRSLGLVIR